jgi:4-amino-4-deoxy-L-arabinose transferase-like glycosyltransferase
LLGLLVVLCARAAYRLAERPSAGRAALLGALIGLAALTRGEAILLLALLLLGRPKRRLRLLAAGVAACALVLAPWTIRNLATFENPVLISTNGDNVFVGANCDRSYYGDLIGSWAFSCFGRRGPGDESQYSREWRQRGLDYARDHAGRIPVVVAARLGRQFDVYRPRQGVFLASAEGRDHRVQWLGIYMFWAMLPLGLAGALVLRRRREPLFILGAPFFLILVMGAAVYGSTRFRVAFEPALIVLSAVALDALWTRWRQPSSAAASSAPASATPTSVSAGISQSQSIDA